MTRPTLMSWGRYPNYPQTAHYTHWREEVGTDLRRIANAYGTTLPFGNGRSYGDSCLAASDHVLHTRSLNRFLSADWTSGVIAAEAGVTLEELLALSIPHGWFLPVSPGTKYVTLGGALANDVHGKNHHVRGTFGNHVTRFGLVRSDSGLIVCSPAENAELFAATIGGLGLTGVVAWVEFKMIAIESSTMNITTRRFNSLAEFFALSNELDGLHEYSVSWVDCLAKGADAGRGVFMAADHAQQGALLATGKKKLNVPAVPPFSAINSLTLRILNFTYYHCSSEHARPSASHYERFFYPLDGVLNWNRVYGKKGFQQYQCVIPDDNAESGTRELLSIISATGDGSFLAVLKKCGKATSPGLLSFPMPGVSLALDFPHNARLASLFRRLDAIVRETGGRLYPAKDSHMSAEDFRIFYPKWTKVESLREPAILSRFWKRVTCP